MRDMSPGPIDTLASEMSGPFKLTHLRLNLRMKNGVMRNIAPSSPLSASGPLLHSSYGR